VKMICLASAESPLIKVVAPGKSRQPISKTTSKKAKTSSKVTVKQMMETFLLTLQGFDERLAKVEKKLDTWSASVKEEDKIKHEELEINYSPITIKHPQQPSLRRSCEFPLGQEEEYLSLSQEMNLMINDSLVLTP